MRRLVLVVPFLFACGGAETKTADSPAAAMAALTEADIAGTWTGTATMEGTDSIIAHWTQICGGGTCRGFSTESPDTVISTYMFEADSSMGSTQPYANKEMGGMMVTDHWVARVSNGMVSGTGMFKSADKDSVLTRYHFSGTKQP